MTFEEWFEQNKESWTQTSIYEIAKRTWSKAWEKAVEKHWLEAQVIGFKEGYEAAIKKDWEG